MPVVEHAPPQSKGRSGEDAVPNAARASTPGPAYPCFRGLRLPARCCTCVAVLAWRCEMCVPGGHEDSMTRLGSKIENHVHGTWRRVPVRSGFSRRGGREPSLRSDRNLVRFYTLFTIRVRPREETVRWHTRAHLICLTILTAATLCCTSPPRLATCIRASHTLPHTSRSSPSLPPPAGGHRRARARTCLPSSQQGKPRRAAQSCISKSHSQGHRPPTHRPRLHRARTARSPLFRVAHHRRWTS